MQKRRNAAIVIVCALVLAIGAYIFISPNKKADDSQVVQEATQPEEGPVKAPNWVDEGQDAKPDYSSADAKPEVKTPEEEVTPTLPAEDKAPLVQEDNQPQVIEIEEDKVVSFSFVESLTDYLLSRFSPLTAKGTPATNVSAKSLNMYFGQNLAGFSIQGDNLNTARKSVLEYAFNADKIKFLYNIYAPALMVTLVDTAINQDREYTLVDRTQYRTLSEAETGVMLRLNAMRIEQFSQVFKALAEDPQILELMGKYMSAVKAVSRANVGLQNAISNESSTKESSTRLKQAIMQRELVKESILQKLRAQSPYSEDNELFYLAQWGFRRIDGDYVQKKNAFMAASDVLADLSTRFNAEAAKLP